MDFSKAVEASQNLPPIPEELEKALPDIFSKGGPGGVGTRIETDEPGKIRGAIQYDFEYHCRRFMIGEKELGVDFDNRQTQVESVDESEDLTDIMNKNLRGEATIINKSETFLKNGTVVVWLEWAVPKQAPPKEKRNYLTVEELKAPGLPSEEDSPGSQESQ
jgi:hypothetical protein